MQRFYEEGRGKILKKYAVYSFKIGEIVVMEEDGFLTDLFIRNGKREFYGIQEETLVLRQTADELEKYFSGKLKSFTVPVALHGTPFQRTVWQALREIPYGETRTYQQIAEDIGNPKACRAVGAANGRNPIWIIIPCHRVIGKDGGMTGYAGGLEAKGFLLELEKENR